MSTYPGEIDEFRNTENLPGVEYDAADTKTVYAEDTNNHSSAIVAIESTLGVNPAGDAESVADRLDAFDTGFIKYLSGVQFAYVNDGAGNVIRGYFTIPPASYTLVLRDEAGRTQFAPPVSDDDAVTKIYADALWPVGAVFTTTAGDDETQPVLPGEWECIASGNLIGAITTYSWERTS